MVFNIMMSGFPLAFDNLKLKIAERGHSASTSDLPTLEKRYSLSKSSDAAFTAPPETNSADSIMDVKKQISLNVPPRDSGMISASAPGSLQSSPRKKDGSVPLSATPEVVDRPRLVYLHICYLYH